MFNANVRTLAALTTLLAGLLAVPACDTDEPTANLAAYTPGHDGAGADPVAGMSLRLAGSAAIELADGEVVDLGLSDEQRANLECDGDATVSRVLVEPLALGDRSFAAPVLEASCDGEGPTARVSLREAGESCEGEGCIAFSGADLPRTSPEDMPLAGCQDVGTRTCVSCGGGRMKPKTITTVISNDETGECHYFYSYGACDYFCAD